jgi:hypothetical protein
MFNRPMLQHRITLLLIKRTRTRSMARDRSIQSIEAMPLDLRQNEQEADT